jgi:hypothetical protein
MDHVLLLSKILRKHVRIFVVCPNIKKEDVEEMFMFPFDSLQEAVDEAIRSSERKDPDILIYPRPQTGLPEKTD